MHHTPNQWDHENPWISTYQQLTAFIEMEPQRTENYQRLAFHYRHTGLVHRSLEVARSNYERNPLSVRSIREYAGALQHADRLEESADMFDLAEELGRTGPNFSKRMIPLQACDRTDMDCVIAGIEAVFAPPFQQFLFDGYEEFFRGVYSPPANDEEAAAAVELAMSKVRETDMNMVNWFNGAACNYDHLTPLFFELLDYVNENGHMARDWFFANSWGPECANVWSDPRFRDYVEEFGFIEYWRQVEWPDACRPEGDSFTCGSE
jgi:hypothetical protein